MDRLGRLWTRSFISFSTKHILYTSRVLSAKLFGWTFTLTQNVRYRHLNTSVCEDCSASSRQNITSTCTSGTIQQHVFANKNPS
ncbi:hypothetical protein DPMN_082179 [Dreissena polymorpha]|uniref:Uncharacterized protein n=1 Tax=Dreissena polymorpha TaxID=45954 RepID=A0A9D3Y374_DREPO|nr:hypothetical protein DPMN_194058 [Dreissena polymorpha]KAH3694738.1 hypothetical protein DPMN_082179 [Dreissena polymorpha]